MYNGIYILEVRNGQDRTAAKFIKSKWIVQQIDQGFPLETFFLNRLIFMSY